MKKYLLLLLLSVYVATAFADEIKVDIEEVTTTPKPRSLVQKPTASIDTETCVLSVKLLSNDSFTLRVLDAVGMEICQFTVISDGTKHPYSLPLLKSGSHTIVIESSNRSYEGEFTI